MNIFGFIAFVAIGFFTFTQIKNLVIDIKKKKKEKSSIPDIKNNEKEGVE